jgi:hypothetical protein
MAAPAERLALFGVISLFMQRAFTGTPMTIFHDAL